MDNKNPLDQLKNAQTEAEELTALEQMAQPLNAPPPTTSLVARAAALFRQRTQQLKERHAAASAQLQFDSWNGSLALGMRNGLIADRQLLFQHENVDVDLQIVPSDDSSHANIQGQLMTDAFDLAGIELRLTQPNGQTRNRITDELGEFSFSLCTSGAHSLTLVLPDGDLVSRFEITTQEDAAS